jgi:hypothetical protein
MRVAIVEAVDVVGLWCVVCVRYLEGESAEVVESWVDLPAKVMKFEGLRS